jgi:hypothetical protein
MTLSAMSTPTDPATDLTDLFAFPSPSRPGHLVLVMDVFPGARPGALFSAVASYRFRVRPVTIRPGPRFGVGADEYPITCTFAARNGRCTLPNGVVVPVRVNHEQGGGSDGVRIFAGLRLDPNFMDIPGYLESVATQRIAFQIRGTNAVQGANVLSIVVELDVATMLGSPAPGTLFAVAAETVADGQLSMRRERFGRAGMKNMYLLDYGVDPVNRDLDLRDLYNQEDPFQLSPAHLGAYHARLNANLHFFDSLDGKLDWPPQPDGAHPLTELLLADYLVVDAGKPYTEDSYLEIERALLAGRTHTTCGGRSLNDDAVDTMATLVMTAGNGPRISDGVDQATVRASRSFPYLVPPNPNPPDSATPMMFPARLAGVTA